MPLRDHFEPSAEDTAAWQEVHAMWPAVIVQHLFRILPEGYVAAPRVHLGAGTSVDQDEFEARVYETARGRRLVSAIEFVSPGNKDRPENRRAFAVKCVAMLQTGVSVSVIDIVTSLNLNLYTDLVELIGRSDQGFSGNASPIHAVTCRVRAHAAPRLEAWAYALNVGQPLPKLPIWPTEELPIPLDLEATYEETCQTLRIP
jgi:hypothetical protein